jgi:hypothetical protein
MSDKITAKNPKEAYVYSQDTGEYLGVIYADPDQQDSDKWLRPRSTTFDKMMLELESNQAAVYSSGEWTAVPDYRGTVYWYEDGTSHIITQLGVIVPDGALLEEPENAQIAEEAQTDEDLEEVARNVRDALANRVSNEINRLEDIGKNASDWRKYRQFLRDVPDQNNFPQNIDWGPQPDDFTGK